MALTTGIARRKRFSWVLQEKRPLSFLDVFAWIGKWFDKFILGG
jgi:hypothetical protein